MPGDSPPYMLLHILPVHRFETDLGAHPAPPLTSNPWTWIDSSAVLGIIRSSFTYLTLTILAEIEMKRPRRKSPFETFPGSDEDLVHFPFHSLAVFLSRRLLKRKRILKQLKAAQHRVRILLTHLSKTNYSPHILTSLPGGIFSPSIPSSSPFPRRPARHRSAPRQPILGVSQPPHHPAGPIADSAPAAPPQLLARWQRSLPHRPPRAGKGAVAAGPRCWLRRRYHVVCVA